MCVVLLTSVIDFRVTLVACILECFQTHIFSMAILILALCRVSKVDCFGANQELSIAASHIHSLRVFLSF